MFDIGFSEIVLIGVVALVVIGPERLPKVARTAGLLFGRLQRYVSGVKEEINRELQLEEVRRASENLRASMEAGVQATAESLRQTGQDMHQQMTPPVAAAPVETASATPSGALADQVPVQPSPAVTSRPAVSDMAMQQAIAGVVMPPPEPVHSPQASLDLHPAASAGQPESRH